LDGGNGGVAAAAVLLHVGGEEEPALDVEAGDLGRADAIHDWSDNHARVAEPGVEPDGGKRNGKLRELAELVERLPQLLAALRDLAAVGRDHGRDGGVVRWQSGDLSRGDISLCGSNGPGERREGKWNRREHSTDVTCQAHRGSSGANRVVTHPTTITEE